MTTADRRTPRSLAETARASRRRHARRPSPREQFLAEAAGLDADELDPEARRALSWLAQTDEAHVVGVARLLNAARQAGS